MFGGSKKKQHVYSGYPGDCSPAQLEALQKFKVFVKTMSDGHPDPRWDDYYLLRFLRARKFVLAQTQKMWKNYIVWRATNDVDNAIYWPFPQLIQLRKHYPHGYHKVDKKFRPVYIERVGFLNVDQVFKFTSPDRLLKYNATSYETLLTTIFDACTQMKKRQTGQEGRVGHTLTILDLKDVKLSQASNAYNFIKPASQMAQDNYPEILGNMFIVNAPFLFTGIWMVVKFWIDDKTKQKIKILGGSYKKQLLEYVDAESLPDFLDGGKCKCEAGCLTHNIGPWNPKCQQMYPYAVGLKKKEEGQQKVENKGFSNEIKKIQQPKQ